MTAPPNFDRIARIYRWLEYASLGTILEQCRNEHLPLLDDSRQALVLGDGDGRFAAALLARNSFVCVDAVDLSRVMLDLLRQRTSFARSRVRMHQTDALTFVPAPAPDLIVTHFFLDCLSQTQVDTLVPCLAASLPSGGLWLVSEFRIPNGRPHWPARAYIRLLYLAFHLLTGLRVTHLPDYAGALRAAGLRTIAESHSMHGLLTTQLWQLGSPTKSKKADR